MRGLWEREKKGGEGGGGRRRRRERPRANRPPTFLSPPSLALALSTHSKEVRKGIARTLTVITASTRAALKAAYAGKKYVPLDLRAKKTRAIRQQLTKAQAGALTARAAKKAAAFPRRKYAVKA